MPLNRSELPSAGSKGEEAFALHCRAELLTPEREYRFTSDRKWRFDFAFPSSKVAIEIEGGTWIAGRHNRGSSIQRDLEKYNRAAKEGWKVLRYTTEMVLRGEAIDD